MWNQNVPPSIVALGLAALLSLFACAAIEDYKRRSLMTKEQRRTDDEESDRETRIW
jgi:type III secretory pathway component EscR